MAIQYSGNAQTSTFAPATKQDIINAVGAALLAAGWTTVSGGTGTTAWKLQSATTPQGFDFRVLMKDNGGTSVTFSIESSDGVLIGGNSTAVGGGWLSPGAGGYVYTVVACKYEAWIYVSPYQATGGTFVAFGVPYVPTDKVTVSRLGWMCGNANNDTDTTVRPSFRTGLSQATSTFAVAGSMQVMAGTALWSADGNSSTNWSGTLSIASFDAAPSGFLRSQWEGGSYPIIDAVIGWGRASVTDPLVFMGQPWDCFISMASYAGDQASTLDGHNWTTATNNNSQPGTIFKAVS